MFKILSSLLTTTCYLFLSINVFAQQLDYQFNPYLASSSNEVCVVHAIEIEKINGVDGKILIGGIFETVNNANRNNIARLNPDGTTDPTFNIGTGANKGVFAIGIQEDGKILIGGDFDQLDGNKVSYLSRLNIDGSIDNTFNIGKGLNDIIRDILIMEDGKILISGNFTMCNGIKSGKIARLNPDGSMDMSFKASTGANSTIRSIARQGNKILVAGSFTSYQNRTCNFIARLNEDGTLDPSFNSFGVDATVNYIGYKNNKIYISGSFTTFNDFIANGVAVLNADGTPDTNFSSLVGIEGPLSYTNIPSVLSIIPRKDGKIWIAGDFDKYDNTRLNRFALINSDATVDENSEFFEGADHIVNIITESIDYIYLGGYFSTFESKASTGIVRIKKKPQKLLISSFDKKNIQDPPFKIKYRSSTSLPVRFESKDTAVVIVKGDLIVIKGQGETIITGFQEGNEEYMSTTASQKIVIGELSHLEENMVGGNMLNVLIYPKQEKGFYKIIIENLLNEAYSFSVLNEAGIEVLNNKNNAEEIEINLSTQPNGNYTINFYFKDETISKRIIKN